MILVKDCSYQEEERMVRDAIFFRCKYTQVRDKCLDLAYAFTLAKDEKPNYKKKRPKRSHRRHPNKGQETNPETKDSQKKPSDSRIKCGRRGFDNTDKKCPAMGQQCRYCKKINHYSKVCRSKEVHKKQTTLIRKKVKKNHISVCDHWNRVV